MLIKGSMMLALVCMSALTVHAQEADVSMNEVIVNASPMHRHRADSLDIGRVKLTHRKGARMYRVAGMEFTPQGAPLFPEPMVFDLVRPLGATKGELEANVLFIQPFRRKLQVDWAPEVEWAYAEGHTIEVELPMYNGHVEAYKMALQGTFGYNKKRTFIHGWQYIGEHLIQDKLTENSLLYLAGVDAGRGKSLFVMLGGRHRSGRLSTSAHTISTWDAVANLSLNKALSVDRVLSIEHNYAYHIGSGHEFRVIPQYHHRLNEDLNIQGGVGYEWFLGQRRAIMAFRVIWEFVD